MTFYHCKECGNLAVKPVEGSGTLVCCGAPMQALDPNTVDAAREKHVPVSQLEDNVLFVTVGSVPHPMTPEHYIQMIAVVQDDTVQYAPLTPSDQPTARFYIDVQRPVTVYEFCNLHGLWMAEPVVEFLFEETVCAAEFPQSCIDA